MSVSKINISGKDFLRLNEFSLHKKIDPIPSNFEIRFGLVCRPSGSIVSQKIIGDDVQNTFRMCFTSGSIGSIPTTFLGIGTNTGSDVHSMTSGFLGVSSSMGDVSWIVNSPEFDSRLSGTDLMSGLDFKMATTTDPINSGSFGMIRLYRYTPTQYGLQFRVRGPDNISSVDTINLSEETFKTYISDLSMSEFRCEYLFPDSGMNPIPYIDGVFIAWPFLSSHLFISHMGYQVIS